MPRWIVIVKEVTSFFTLIVVVPIDLLPLVAAFAIFFLGTTVFIPVDNILADALPDAVRVT